MERYKIEAETGTGDVAVPGVPRVYKGTCGDGVVWGRKGLLKEEGMVSREVVRVFVGAKVAKERYED